MAMILPLPRLENIHRQLLLSAIQRTCRLATEGMQSSSKCLEIKKTWLAVMNEHDSTCSAYWNRSECDCYVREIILSLGGV